MSSESTPRDDSPSPSNASKFRQKRLPYSKLTCAIDEGKNKLRDTLNEMDKIRGFAEDGGLLYSEIAGDLIVRASDIRARIGFLEKRKSSFGVLKYLHCDGEVVVLLAECEHTLALAKCTSEYARRTSEYARRMSEASPNFADPRGTSSRSSNPPDRPGNDEEDRASTESTSSFNAADYSFLFPHRPIIIKAKQVSLSFHDSHTTVRGITLDGPNADGFTFNCHTTESRGSVHNNMKFPPTSASEVPAPESATPGSGV
ncbi:hypothetical protein SCLCIDRAFT_652580 [Scleroderma citrinum Foug A]|uniref:Uncharacterized protein n=1 Tax=Scleroderma citrinum Foug A TaxID=1036808 RepID=A0A0C2YNQ8_9AGAM|nr:hypothetical protein SCLCIDRAFT_652580 [Scleroderma citrinum Foug A]